VPYTVVAVDLPAEQIVVLGPLARDVDPAVLEVGTEVELELAPLYDDDEHEYVVWSWRPMSERREAGIPRSSERGPSGPDRRDESGRA
jgi:hypothetical protein